MTDPNDIEICAATSRFSDTPPETSRSLKDTSLPPLRLLTCGSVAAGKSTLLGRLLSQHRLITDDELTGHERGTKKHATMGEDIDFGAVLDGPAAEREQGATIEAAYCCFSTGKRSFIAADTPGHDRHTRAIATGASKADLAILVVDARKGLLTPTFRDATIVALLGIRHVVLAVNKIDLVGYDQAIFEDIAKTFAVFAMPLEFRTLAAIPIAAQFGDNVSEKSDKTPWYSGPSLVAHLEHADVEADHGTRPFRMPVQWVNRLHFDFRGFAGTIAGGSIHPGDEIVVAGSDRTTRVARIVTAKGDLDVARAGDAVTLKLFDEIDVAPGDVLAALQAQPVLTDQFAAHLIWMGEDDLLPGRSYLMKIGARTLPAMVTKLKYRIDVETLSKLAAKTLSLDEVGFCDLATTTPVAIDPYVDNSVIGSFVLIDRFSNATVAAGLVVYGLRRAMNISHHDRTITKELRARQKHQRPAVVWFTGLSGSGKSTIANLVEARLHGRGVHTILLDGDHIRHGLNKDLAFTAEGRVENIRRVGEVTKLMTEAGLVVLCAFISPFTAERQAVRELLDEGEFIEVFVDTPLEVCIARDPKGLYKKALAGEIANFTGIDQAYEAPAAAELVLAQDGESAEQAALRVISYLVEQKFVLDC